MKPSIVNFYKKTKNILKSCSIENKIPYVTFLIFISTILEIFGIGMIIPIVATLTDIDNSYTKFISNLLFQNYDQNEIIFFFLAIFLSIIVIKNILFTYIEYYKANFTHEVHKKILSFFYSAYLKASLDYFIKKNTSYVISVMSVRIPNYVGTLASFAALLSELILCFFLILFLLAVTPSVAILATFIVLIILLSYTRILKNMLHSLGSTRDKHESSFIQNFYETLNFLKEITIFRAKKHFQKISDIESNKFVDAKLWITFYQSFGKIFFETIIVIFLTIFLYFANKFDQLFLNSLPLLGVYIAAAIKFLPSLNRISNSLQYITYNFATTENIENELNSIIRNNNDQDNKEIYSEKLIFENCIDLQNLSFSFPDGKKIFENLNLKIKKGETVAIIGESGLGKSTLVEIMCGFLYPTKGEVLIDGKNLKKYSSQWKTLIGYVPQDTFILNDTLKQNVGLFDASKDKIDEDKVHDCLNTVGLSGYIKDQKEGLRTVLSESGKSLSGGQKQRIGIARNLYKNSEIIFFDEPTSALDEKTEDELLKQLKIIKKKTTLIIVTHKKKVASFCDRVVDLDKIISSSKD